MQQLRAGQAAKDVVRNLEADGWSRDDAVRFVGKVEEFRQDVDAPRGAPTALELEERFPDMRPIYNMPLTLTVKGCGFALYGARDHDPQTGSYIKTHVICLIFFPLFALGAYRVTKADEGWDMIGKEPLSAFARTWNILIVPALLGWLALVSP